MIRVKNGVVRVRRQRLYNGTLLIYPRILVPLARSTLTIVNRSNRILPNYGFTGLQSRLHSRLRLVRDLTNRTIRSFTTIMNRRATTLFIRPRLLYRQRGTHYKTTKNRRSNRTLYNNNVRHHTNTKNGSLFIVNRNTIRIRDRRPSVQSYRSFCSSFSNENFPPSVLLLARLFCGTFPFLWDEGLAIPPPFAKQRDTKIFPGRISKK